MGNRKLINSKKNRDDEYFTTYESIEFLLSNDNFINKVKEFNKIWLPCDDVNSAWVKLITDNRLTINVVNITNINNEFNLKYENGKLKKISSDKVDFTNRQNMSNYLGEKALIITNPPFSKLREFFLNLFLYEQTNNIKVDFVFIVPLNFFGSKIAVELKQQNRFFVSRRIRRFIHNSKEKQISGFIVSSFEIEKQRTLQPPLKQIETISMLNKETEDWYEPYLLNTIKDFEKVYFEKEVYNESNYYLVPITALEYDLSNFEILGSWAPTANGKMMFKRILLKENKGH